MHFPKIGKRLRLFTLTSLSIVIDIIASVIRHKKKSQREREINAIHIGKEKMKLPLLTWTGR